MAASASWTVLLKPDEQLVKATKAGGKVGLQIGSSTTADDFVKSLAASFPVPKGKTVQIYDERVLDSQDSQDGDSYKVMITAADLVSEVQAVMEGADIDSLSYTSTNAGKSVVRLSAGLANVPKVSAQSQAKGNSLSEPEAKSMRSAMDMYCSRDSKSAFHLVTGSPKQWPLAIEAVVASVKLEYPSVKEDSLRSAIVKRLDSATVFLRTGGKLSSGAPSKSPAMTSTQQRHHEEAAQAWTAKFEDHFENNTVPEDIAGLLKKARMHLPAQYVSKSKQAAQGHQSERRHDSSKQSRHHAQASDTKEAASRPSKPKSSCILEDTDSDEEDLPSSGHKQSDNEDDTLKDLPSDVDELETPAQPSPKKRSKPKTSLFQKASASNAKASKTSAGDNSARKGVRSASSSDAAKAAKRKSAPSAAGKKEKRAAPKKPR